MEKVINHLSQHRLAENFHALHHQQQTLLLINAWDCASAKMIEAAGFPAIATSSAGLAWSLGFADGEKILPEVHLEALKRICNTVQVSVSADIEGGYFRNDIHRFSIFIEQLIDAGIIGINLEDGYAHEAHLNDISLHTTLINTAKEMGYKKGIDLFVNARTDAMLLPGTIENKIQTCIERASAFAKAGADGIFIPFIKELETIAVLKSEIQLPLNILATDSLPFNKLQELKVNRVSTGSRPMMFLLNHFRKLLHQVKIENIPDQLFSYEITYNEINSWFL